MTSRGAVPGSTVVKQGGNISGEVSKGLDKSGEQHTGQLFSQHATQGSRERAYKMSDDVPEPPPSQ